MLSITVNLRQPLVDAAFWPVSRKLEVMVGGRFGQGLLTADFR